MARVIDVAKYILENEQGHMSTMKLQKLCYYSQAWNLVWDEKPLYQEPIEAWANGPVSRALFACHKGKFKVGATDIPGDSTKLNQDERDTVDAVLSAYGHLSGQQLSDMTHSERPWREAREGLPDGASSRAPLDLDVIQDFYGGLDSAAANR